MQASALDVEFDVTILRYSFFELLELILQSCNVNHMYIFRILYFLGGVSPLLFQSYRELSNSHIETFFQDFQLTDYHVFTDCLFNEKNQ